jgi:hypothetical protein
VAKITFTSKINIHEDYNPVPSSKNIPDWYKNIDSYWSHPLDENSSLKKRRSRSTIKRCMPVFDAISAGYLLLTYTDIFVEKRTINSNIEDYYEWPTSESVDFDVITFHPVEQANLYPGVTKSIPKWMNPWIVKTPPGYSSYFTAPAHRDSPFVALPAVVDTDTFNECVNIVFQLKDPNFEGLIPAGTPIAQITPFKREEWEMEFGSEKDIHHAKTINSYLHSVFADPYKNKYRQPKIYK